MSAAAVTKIARPPQMRRLGESATKMRLIISTVCAFAGATLFKYTVTEPRKKAYAEFARTYDIQKEFETMKSKGLFQSC